MHFLIGLGNPGPRYQGTRHNLGFLALEALARAWDATPFREEPSLHMLLSEASVSGKRVFLGKPTVFMNDSGVAIAALLRYYHALPESLLVLHDDLDIAPGTLRFARDSRAAGHNGVQNIFDVFATQKISRLRLGIGRPTEILGACEPSHDFVLGRFTEAERSTHEALFEHAEAEARAWLALQAQEEGEAKNRP
jgi:PTH1 family peptidyl-tRNA hydrolase